jgi:hypothetical protein
MNLYFRETQKFTQWWLWVLLIGMALIPVNGIYKQIIIGEQFGNNPLSNLGLILFLIFMLSFVGFFWMMELSTEINEVSIRMKFFPFINKNIKWADIKSAEVVNYGFVGGWGIRMGTKYGLVYNIRGNKGLAIELKNRKKICIGTQKENELKAVIREARRLQKLKGSEL